MSKTKKLGYSGRGGSRENAGRPTTWNNTPTTAVRVPEPLLSQILAYAHELDNGAVQNQTDTNEQLIEIIIKWQNEALVAKSTSRDWTKCRQMLKELQSALIPPNDE
jgi:hypothetical protein